MLSRLGFRFLFLWLTVFFTLPVQALNVLFINPSVVGNPHWDKAQQLIENAAHQLDINLQVVHVSLQERGNLSPLLAAFKDKQNRPQAVIFLAYPFDDNQRIFSFLEARKLPFITLEDTLGLRERKLLGFAGEKFKYWLTEKKFDDKKTGYLLAKQLINKASEKFSEPISLVAISGSHIKISELRNAGLRQALVENPQVNFKQLVYNNWDKQISRNQARKLMLRYPETKIIWTASDSAGIGAYEASLELGKKPGKDVIIGGIDWQSTIFPLMQEGRYCASVGGQVLAAASALVYFYDYYHGVDKKVLKNMPNLKIDLITDNDLPMLEFVQTAHWENLNFKTMSIKYNPAAAFTEIGLKSLLLPKN